MSCQPTVARSVSESLFDDPVAYFSGSFTRMEQLDRETLPELQLEALQRRFGVLRDAIPTLSKLADRQRIATLEAVDDVVPVLFDHAIYKSYPSQLIMRRQFATLTTWLSRLTTRDLSEVDPSACTSIDTWLAELDTKTELRVAHTSGTSGTISFLPWSHPELEQFIALLGMSFTQRFGSEADWRETEPIDVLFPYFRHGAAMATRQNEATEKLVAQGPDRFHALFAGRLSADVVYLAARLRAAKAKGQEHTIDPDRALLARKDEFERQLAAMPAAVESFLAAQARDLAGRRVWTLATWNMIHQMAASGLAQGHRAAFAPDSVVIAAGGAKGWKPPDDWKETIRAFFGVERLRRCSTGCRRSDLASRLCEHGHYHLSPWIIPFVLASGHGEPLPRPVCSTGRAAYFDLLARDAVGRLHHRRRGDRALGRALPVRPDDGRYLDGQIARLSDKRGGDDKISCVATEEAHQEALEYLTRSSRHERHHGPDDRAVPSSEVMWCESAPDRIRRAGAAIARSSPGSAAPAPSPRPPRPDRRWPTSTR